MGLSSGLCPWVPMWQLTLPFGTPDPHLSCEMTHPNLPRGSSCFVRVGTHREKDERAGVLLGAHYLWCTLDPCQLLEYLPGLCKVDISYSGPNSSGNTKLSLRHILNPNLCLRNLGGFFELLTSGCFLSSK